MDDIVTVDDFLAVSENHILEDVNKCCLALQEGDSETLDRFVQNSTLFEKDIFAIKFNKYFSGLLAPSAAGPPGSEMW